MKKRTTILASIFFLTLFATSAFGQISADSNITEDTVWNVADSPVTVTETISVTEGATLTIEPGVVVFMGNDVSLLIEGTLIADGTESDQIVFTSEDETSGSWGSIEFRNTSNVGSVFDYVTVEYGAGTNRSGMVFYTTGSFPVAVSNSVFRNSAVHGINLRASSVPISNSEFYDNAGYGIFADLSLNFSVTESNIYQNIQGGIRVPLNSQAVITESSIENNGIGILIENNGRPEITNSQITDNNTGIRIQEVGSSQPLIRENIISGNSVWGVESLGGNVLDARFNFWGSPQGPTVNTNPTGNGDAITTNIDYTPWRDGSGMDLPVVTVDSNISDDTTWESGNVYLVTVNLTVGSNAVLTIEPGTIVKFGSGRSMTVNGSLTANGTESNMIVFTSDRDDSAGGDSNDDGDATTPGPGNWGKIVIDSPGSEISHSIIRYGSAGGGNAGVLDLDAPVSLNDIFVTNNSGNGIYSEVPQSGWTNVNTISNSSRGIFMREVALQMSGGASSLNGGTGIYFSSTSSNQASILDDIEVTNNSSHGIHVQGSSNRSGNRIGELTNSVISGNSTGVLLEYSDSGPQLFQNNVIEDNSSHGITLHHGLNTEDVIFEGNTVSNNGQSGIRANSARFIDNSFTGNRFGIGTWYDLGITYTDDADVDSNSFSNNTYGGIALYSTGLNGTLSATVPQAFENPTYILATVGTANSSSDTLIIEPGVTIKTGPGVVNNNTSFRVDGTLIAEGTEEDPIVFTSLFDEEYGDDVAPEGNTNEASPDDWGGINLNNDGTRDSKLEHVVIRYGRTNLDLGTSGSNQVEYTNTFNNLWIDNAAQNGIFIEESSVKFNNILVTNSGRHGIWLRDRRSNGFVSTVEINFSEIRGNGGTNSSYAGLYAQSLADGSTFEIAQGNLIEENANGIVIEDAASTTSIANNTIRNNVHHGVTLVSDRERDDISFFGNTISGNGKSGILSSKAVIIDNRFIENQFGVAAWNRLGHVFVDENDEDGNEFTGNTYNNAIGLYATSLRDTLSATMPAVFENPAYILVTSGTALNSSHTLLIEPGVTVKTGPDFVNSNTSLRFDGTLLAEGTEEDPIVFTSLYDHEYGGNIALEESEEEAAPDDWGGINLNNDGTRDSKLGHVYIRYGRTNLDMGTSGSNQVEYTNTFNNLWIDNAAQHGIFIEESSAEFDNLKVTNSGRHGVWLRDRRSNGFFSRAIIQNSEITNNGGTNSSYAGLYASSLGDGASFSEITETVIKDNSNGVVIESSPLPTSFQFNEIADNVHNGIFARMTSVSSDTALAVSGNSFTGHLNGAGLISTRAVIEDNSFENNEFPIAVMGEVSRDETVNASGNFYEGNSFSNNTYRDAIGIYSTNSISLDGNLGYSWPDEFSNPVYVPITGTTYINSGDSVNVAPGTVIKLGRSGSNDSFRIRGTLIAEGEADKKIIFTSLIDDTYGGDTNRDSTDTAPSRADWGELLVDGSSSSQTRFKHVIARYGSSNFEFTNDSEAIIDSSFSSNATNGIYTQRGAKPTVRNSDIHTNRYGMRVQSNSDDPNIHVNNFYNNDDAALYVFRDVTAINNYWGHSTGPFVDQGSNTDPNLDGQGNQILVSGSNRVEYEPWRVSRSGVLLGDVSESGSVSAFDASLILQYSVGDITLSTSQLAAADVSGDGTVSAFDASQILQFVVGIISGFDGAGKIPSFAPEDIFALDTRITDSHFDVVIQSQGNMPLLAGEIALDYDEVRFSSVELLSSGETANWSNRVRAENGVAKAALAGVEAAATAGDLIHLRFHFEDEFAGAPGEFEITNLVLNELNLTESANNVLTSSVDEHQLPQKFALEQNFPNPFNPTTNIRYQLPESGEVTVSVFNAIGQQVAILANREQQTAGVYTLNWDAGSAASGVYFYRIEVAGSSGSNFMDVRKMTLIK